MSTINNEKDAILWKELIEYEQSHEMTTDERNALREWVMNGNSVHDNASMSYTEHGVPSDFLDVYRYEEEVRCKLEKMSPGEQENYIARLCGEDTIDNLREDLDKLYFKVRIYEQILQINGLLEEEELRIKAAEEESKKQELQFREWRMLNPDIELPFD